MQIFEVEETVKQEDQTYLKLADGRGWVTSTERSSRSGDGVEKRGGSVKGLLQEPRVSMVVMVVRTSSLGLQWSR